MEIHIGHLIKKEMICRGLNPTILAERINVSRPDVYNIFKRKTMDAELIGNLSVALGIDIFEVLSNEIKNLLGDRAPKEMLEREGLMSFLNYGDDRAIYYMDGQHRHYILEEHLHISLLLNGAGFFEEEIVLPDSMYPKLIKSYERATDGPLDGLDDDAIGERFFPWLERHCPRQAECIKEAVEDTLLWALASPDSEPYREALDFNDPTSVDEWYSLNDNNIEYWLNDLPERIFFKKRLV